MTGWACNAHGMPTFRVHQTDYPEIEAEGQTPAEACGRLVQLWSGPSTSPARPGAASPSGWPSSMPAASIALHRRCVDRAETLPAPLDVGRPAPPAHRRDAEILKRSQPWNASEVS